MIVVKRIINELTLNLLLITYHPPLEIKINKSQKIIDEAASKKKEILFKYLND